MSSGRLPASDSGFRRTLPLVDPLALGRELAGLAEAAGDAATLEEHDHAVLERLGRLIGFDLAFFVRGAGPGPVAPGFLASVRRATAGRWHVFRREMEGFREAVRPQGGVGIDREFFGAALERQAIHDELMQPHRGRSSLVAYLTRRGTVQATLVLGRTGRSTDFDGDDRSLLAALAPTLAICDAAAGRAPAPASPEVLATLTTRERDVLEYLILGYTNAEIALARGTSPATIRNQLSSIFRKLGATTRAEAVAIALRSPTR